jgi:hypothetical protein
MPTKRHLLGRSKAGSRSNNVCVYYDVVKGYCSEIDMRGKGVKLVCLLLFVVASGCDIFSTRTPEDPNTSNTFIWTPANSPQDVLNNLIGTMRDVDAVNYVKLFVQDGDSAVTGSTAKYRFVPRPDLDPSTLSLFTGWNVESERSYLSRLRSELESQLQKSPHITLTLTNPSFDINGDNATVNAEYALSLPVEQVSGVRSPVTGTMTLELQHVNTVQSSTEWRIATWSDIPTSSTKSSAWTDLKAQLGH